MLLHEFVSKLKKEDTVLIDIRTQEERDEQGFIEESLWVPMTNFLEDFTAKKISKSSHIMIFCFSGFRAEQVSKMLKLEGYQHVDFLEDNVNDLLSSFIK